MNKKLEWVLFSLLLNCVQKHQLTTLTTLTTANLVLELLILTFTNFVCLLLCFEQEGGHYYIF